MSKQADDSFFNHVRSFLTVYLPRSRCYSPNTVKAYRDTINLFRSFLQEQKNIPFTRISFRVRPKGRAVNLPYLQVPAHFS